MRKKSLPKLQILQLNFQVAVPVPVELPTAAVPVEPTTAAVPVEPPTAADPTGEPQDFLTTYFQQATCEHGLPECACLFFWKSTRLSALFFLQDVSQKGKKPFAIQCSTCQKNEIQFGRPFFEQQCFCAKNRGNF